MHTSQARRALAALAVCGCLGAAPAEHQTFRSTTNVVLVDVLVRQDRRVVADIDIADLELFDNGVKQQIELVSAGPGSLPIDVDLLVDVSRSADQRVLPLGAAVVRAVRGMLGDRDRLELITFGSLLRREAIASEMTVPRSADLRHTALWDALAARLMRAADPARRKLVIVLTDGVDTNSIVDAGVVLAIAETADATVHILAVPPPRFAPAIFGDEFTGFVWHLRRLAGDTGGSLHIPTSGEDLLEPIRTALGEMRQGLLLRYVPTGVEPEGWHEITVRLVRPGRFEVSARRGYEWR